MADYSYYFVMKRYLPLLEQLGAVEVLTEPPSDEFVAACQEEDSCYYFSFTPPDKVVSITRCPVIVVFAWEFSTIPYESFTRPEDNWVCELQILGRAITHSSYAVGVVRGQLDQNFQIESIPAPLWDSCEPIRASRKSCVPRGLSGIDFNCRAIDSASYEFSNTYVRPISTESDINIRPLGHVWKGEPIELRFREGNSTSALIGFNKPEAWGAWSKPGYPWLLLNQLVVGHIELTLTVQGYAQNVGERLRVECGTACADLLLTESLSTHVFELYVEQPSNVVAFLGIIERAMEIVDPRDIGFGLSALSIRRIDDPMKEAVILALDLREKTLVHEGFHEGESWGRWTAATSCTIFLPRSVRGNVTLAFSIPHALHNDGHTVDVSLGGHVQSLSLEENVHSYELVFPNNSSTNYLCIDNLRIGSTGSESDPRAVGTGMSEIVLTMQTPESVAEANITGGDPCASTSIPADSDGIMYTAILNPMDARKNWEDIITAFVYAFRDNDNVTLVMKITHYDFSRFFEDIFTFFTELYPFKCRLIFVHGFFTEKEYTQLLEHSHFIVNASSGEGQCLPLMEFMSAGVPAIAPRHTAMLDYLNPDNSFVVESSPEPTSWPQDPRDVFRAECQRINWESLRKAFIDSERTFCRSPGAYLEMSRAAIDSLERYCSIDVASERLSKFLTDIPQREDR